MIVRNSETRSEKIQNQTVNGFNISVLLEAAANNVAVPITGYRNTTSFDPSNITLEISLMRNGVRYELFNGNLALLAHFQTIAVNGNLWRKGITLRKKAAAIKHLVTRSIFVYLGGHYNLKGTDEMICTATVNRGTFGSAVSEINSSIQIESNTSIGVEYAIHRMHTYSIQASNDNDVVNLGDNVTRIALISFEQDFEKPIFKSASLSSDRLDWTCNEQELIAKHWYMFPYNSGDELLSGVSDTEHPLYYPNSFLVHDKDEIDKGRLSFTLDGPNVKASENYVMWTTFITNQDMLQKAVAMKQKHEQADIAKIPLG